MLDAKRIAGLLAALNGELARKEIKGEIYMAGGAVMCLAFHDREATKDIDALMVPAAELREAAALVGEREGLAAGWINDAVKGFFSQTGRFDVYRELSHLRVLTAHPEYLLAMKCLAARLGNEFQDERDIALLLGSLGVNTVVGAVEILERYYPLARYPVRARYLLEELLPA